ncbi:MAG TPA: DUF4097 family beta strand repeat-containing protein [Bryobacteraceae bacterium]|nr:DUF4097 family beta strand repeat-containing protein [Bryobacteraceae bacterium]
MKRFLALTGLTFAVCALVGAQDSAGDRVVVPARNTTHPRVVNAVVTHGSITVKSYNGKDVIVEASNSGSDRGRRTDRTVDGLHRIDLPPRGLVVEEEDNVIQVRASSSDVHNLTISVPADTALQLRSTHGNLNAEGIHGEIEAHSTNGEIRLTGISGTVVADTTNGSITVSMDKVDPGKPIAFSTTNGNVDVTLPADLKANFKLRSFHGEIWSDFDMKLSGGQPVTTNGGSNGRFRVEFDRTIFATINGGGTEASFNSFNGRIMIRKK